MNDPAVKRSLSVHSPRTLEQEEVNREVRRLAEELSSRPGIAFG